MQKTWPKPSGIDEVADAPRLLEGRYGTKEMCDIWGTDADTYLAIMNAQVAGLDTINEMHPGRLPEKYVEALRRTANFEHINPDDVRREEARTKHDVIAVNNIWGQAAEKAESGASSIINFMRTSADSTEPAKAMRCKQSFEVLADSLENLRDILLERSMEWIDAPHIDQTHLYDALPTVAGRPVSHYAEMLQSDLDVIAFFHRFSLLAKWAGETGNHHNTVAGEINGIELQEAYARKLGLRCMTAPAQIAGREFNADIIYALSRTSGTLANIGNYVSTNRGSDAALYSYMNPNRAKGSAGMPHKDLFGGNPTAEEQAQALLHGLAGKMVTAIETIKMDYARNLDGSATDRLDLGPAFKFTDHVTRRLAEVFYWLELDRDRALERLNRTYGVVTSSQVLTYLTDPMRTSQPMPRKQAHNLLGDLAARAYLDKRQFFDVLTECPEVTERIDADTLKMITDPVKYIGQSKKIIERNYGRFYRTKTFNAPKL